MIRFDKIILIFLFILQTSFFQACKTRKEKERELEQTKKNDFKDRKKLREKLKSSILKSPYYPELIAKESEELINLLSSLELRVVDLRPAHIKVLLPEDKKENRSKWEYIDLCIMDLENDLCRYSYRSSFLEKIYYPLPKGTYYIKARACTLADQAEYLCGPFSKKTKWIKHEGSSLNYSLYFAHQQKISSAVKDLYLKISQFLVLLKEARDQIHPTDRPLYRLDMIISSFTNLIAIGEYEFLRQIFLSGPIYTEILKAFKDLHVELEEKKAIDMSACHLSALEITAIFLGLSVIVGSLGLASRSVYKKAKKALINKKETIKKKKRREVPTLSFLTSKRKKINQSQQQEVFDGLTRGKKKKKATWSNLFASIFRKHYSLALSEGQKKVYFTSEQIEQVLSEATQDVENFFVLVESELKKRDSLVL